MEQKMTLTPEQQIIIENTKRYFQQSAGITDEDWAKHISNPVNIKLALFKGEIKSYKIVAEVVESKYCSAGIKVGHKYVFSTLPTKLLREESTCPECLRAVGPITSIMHGFWDRMIEGLDPNTGMWKYVRCMDWGVNYGGMGTVMFKVYAEKI